MAKELTFTQDNNRYICEVESEGIHAVQIEMASKGHFAIFGCIDGLNPVEIYRHEPSKSLLLELDIPEGVTIRMVAWEKVESAKLI